MASKNASKEPRNRVRIIGGQWRGRTLGFVDGEGLRPTPDRVRETLFNWLQHELPGARCLDLFAGSGALGFEALSRGAAAVTAIEPAAAAFEALCNNIRALEAAGIEAVRTDAFEWLTGGKHGGSFDIAFLDPPFGNELLEPACAALEQSGRLASGARIYLESGEPFKDLTLPPSWRPLKEKKAGRVFYALYGRGD